MRAGSSGRGVEGFTCRTGKGAHKGRPYRRLRWVSADGQRSAGPQMRQFLYRFCRLCQGLSPQELPLVNPCVLNLASRPASRYPRPANRRALRFLGNLLAFLICSHRR